MIIFPFFPVEAHLLLSFLLAEFRQKNAGRKAQSKAKDTNKTPKRKEPPTTSEGRSKRHEVENGREDDSD